MKCCGGTVAYEPAPAWHPLFLGSLDGESYHSIINRIQESTDMLLAAFALWGPKRLGDLLGDDFWGNIEKPPFFGLCDTCCRLFGEKSRVARLREAVNEPPVRRRVDRATQIAAALDRSRKDRWEANWDYDSWRGCKKQEVVPP